MSAVFLPLNLLAGLFGVKFEGLLWLGPRIALGLMSVTAAGFLLWFRRRRI